MWISFRTEMFGCFPSRLHALNRIEGMVALLTTVGFWGMCPMDQPAQSVRSPAGESAYAAIVSPISFGIRPPFQGDRRGSEWPVRQSITFSQPAAGGILVLLEGVLQSDRHPDQYADPVHTWQGLRKSRGGTARVPTLTAHNGLVLTARKADGSQLLVAVADGAWRAYSFRQNRVLVAIPSDSPLVGLEIDARALNARYRGAFRVHVFGMVPESTQPTTGQVFVRFVDYADPPREWNVGLGEPVATTDDEVFPESGDFLLLIGSDLDSVTTTNRTMTGLPAGKTVKVQLEGLFIFSGYGTSRFGTDEARAGGGGGTQDAGQRQNHYRDGIDDIYDTLSTAWNDCSLHCVDKTGTECSWSLGKRRSGMAHTYEATVEVPPDGTIYWFVRDWSIKDGPGANTKSEDNAGVLFVRYLGEK